MFFKNQRALLNHIQFQIDKKLSPSSFALFDADGTLWREDLNDRLLEYQQKRALRDFSDLLESMRQGLKGAPLCVEFARKQGGLSPEELKYQCREAIREKPLHIFSFQKEILHYLKKKKVFICVLSASLKRLVEEGIRQYQLPVDKVLGVENPVEGGTLLPEIIPPLTFGKGKKEAFLKEIGDKKVLLAAGNTLSDRFLLDMAGISLVILSASPEDRFFDSERELRKLALRNRWILFEASKIS